MKCFKGIVSAVVVLGLTTAGWAETTETKKSSMEKAAIRVAVRNTPGADEFELDGGGISGTATLHENGGGQVDILLVKRFMGKDGADTVGGVLGGGVFLNNQGGENADLDGDIGAVGALFEGGLAARLGDRIVVEALPFFGLGISSVDITDKTGTLVFETAAGGYVMYGVKGGIYLCLGDTVELGAEVGYSGFSSTTTYEMAGVGNVDATFSGGGIQGGAVLAIKF